MLHTTLRNTLMQQVLHSNEFEINHAWDEGGTMLLCVKVFHEFSSRLRVLTQSNNLS